MPRVYQPVYHVLSTLASDLCPAYINQWILFRLVRSVSLSSYWEFSSIDGWGWGSDNFFPKHIVLLSDCSVRD